MKITPNGRRPDRPGEVGVFDANGTDSLEALRALTQRMMQAQEVERVRVAADLHDRVTQLLCGVIFRSQALLEGISNGPARREAATLRRMLGHTAGEVERISQTLRPGRLKELGLIEVLRDITRAFADRAGVSVSLKCSALAARLPTKIELALYRILQEAFKNVEKHARACRVTVTLRQQAARVLLVIKDDGIGFDSSRTSAHRRTQHGLGLLGMRERAIYAGGSFEVASRRGAGTEIKVRVPVLAARAGRG